MWSLQDQSERRHIDRKKSDIATHYSAAKLAELIAANHQINWDVEIRANALLKAVT